MTNPKKDTPELLIASVSPPNLERGVLWFSEHAEEIKRARRTNPWWRDETIYIEQDLAMKPSAFVRRLVELGYERSSVVLGRGAFAVRGGVIELWPINAELPYLVEFFGNTIAAIRPGAGRRPAAAPRPARTVASLTPGSFVVHRDHGIGIFRGSTDNGFFIVEYAPARSGGEPDRLFVPHAEEKRLTPYVGFNMPAIHRLGGALWTRTTRRVKENAEKLARELVAIYERRMRAERPPYPGDPALEEIVASAFAHQETEGQSQALDEIMRDLASGRPMERLLAGDVGFGKTELALRAALRVIASGFQVAVVAPTTVLAAQHEKIFRERYAGTPVTVELLSRLTPPAAVARILAGIRNGSVDCIIGTHRLFSRDIEFKKLGLVIIDEEQRFGVRHKEHFTALRASTDLLSLSATPIPRTLQFTLSKLRDLSVIETPPAGRIPIATLVLPRSRKTIRRAIAQELARGGQVYFLHNRIETMGHALAALRDLLRGNEKRIMRAPVIEAVHGRMPERSIIRIMDDFRAKKIDVLVATTIIENGIDISSANTLIVDDATRLGLAEAHQLRGRIGRGTERAFAYFLYRPGRLTPEAAERLEALEAYADLGAGFQIALRDLELRGAGNILGKEQSGAINSVGLNLYCQMLAEAVETERVAEKNKVY